MKKHDFECNDETLVKIAKEDFGLNEADHDTILNFFIKTIRRKLSHKGDFFIPNPSFMWGYGNLDGRYLTAIINTAYSELKEDLPVGVTAKDDGWYFFEVEEALSEDD